MQFDVITLFPEMFGALTASGVTRRAFEQKRCELRLWNPRDFTSDNHRTVDDRPYGGGPGMVMMAAPLEAAIKAGCQRQTDMGLPKPRTIYLSPQGQPLNHPRVMQLSQEPGLLLFFPPGLAHSVEPNQSGERRLSIAFNLGPDGD